MSKLIILILYSALALFSCEKQKSGSGGNKSAKPTPATTAKTEKNAQSSSNSSSVNWQSMPRFGCVSAPSGDTLWAIVEDQDSKLISTEDGGATWKTVREKNVSCVNFADENHGWLKDSADGQILATADGGKTWSKTLPDGAVSSAQEIKFTDSTNGWFKDSTDVHHSSDGGKNWKMVLGYEKTIIGQPDGWFFSDSRTGWICDAGDKGGNIYRTSDAGETWSIKRVGKNDSSPCRIFFVNPAEGFYSLQKQFFKTSDGGENWNQVSSLPAKFEVRSMFWFDAESGLMAGYFDQKPRQPQAGKGALLRTADGGKTWTETAVGENVPFFTEIIFTDSRNGWLVSRDNIYKTSDGGEKWSLSYSLPPVKSPPES